jgi:DHA3 family macrolide efflux protein-like MFS transporter
MLFQRIFQNRNLALLWLGQMVSQSGDSIYQIGLLWLVLELSRSTSVTGLVAMASYFPAVLLSLFAGVAADRGDRRKIMLISDAARFILVLLVPLSFLFGLLDPAFLGINAFAIAIAATFFNPARDAFIPQIVSKDGLLRANSLIQTSWQFALLLGPATAGGLLHYLGNVQLFTACSLAYLFSFVFLFLIRQHRHSPLTSRRPTGLSEVKEGLQFALRHPVIFPLLLITIGNNLLIMGPAIVGTPVFVKEILRLDAKAYAMIMACFAIGMLLGSGALFLFGGRFKKGQMQLAAMVLDGITFIPLYFVKSLLATIIIVVIHALAIPLLTVSRTSLIQDIVPSHMTGRIFALINLSVVGMSAISSGLAGFALEFVQAPTLFLLTGIGVGLCGALGWIFAKHLRATN